MESVDSFPKARSLGRVLPCIDFSTLPRHTAGKHGTLVPGGHALLLNLEVCDIHFVQSHTQLQMA